MWAGLFVTGAVVLLIGAGFALSVYQDNIACGSSIGLIGQGYNQTVAQECQNDALVFDGGVILGLIGFIALLGGAVLRDEKEEERLTTGSAAQGPGLSQSGGSPPQLNGRPPGGPTTPGGDARFCTFCGEPARPTSEFCVRCGGLLRPLPPPPRP